MKDIEDGKVRNVLVFKIDRLTRSTKNLIELVDFFNAYNCGFNSLLEAIDTNTATGRMFIKIIGIFAEFERENLIERVKVGNARKAKEGYTTATYTPSYGYERNQGEKIQSVIAHEAEIVREIFHLYVNENYSLTKISHLLNARGIPTKKNSRWSCKTVGLIISNPTYIGKVRYQIDNELEYSEFDGLHEAILDEKIFYQAKSKLERMNKTVRTKHVKSEAYFTGIAVCEKCGTKFTPKRTLKPKNKKLYISYRCLDFVKGLCSSSVISHLKLEKAFVDYIDNLEDLTEVNDNDLIDNQNVGLNDDLKELTDIEKDIVKLVARANEIMDLYTSLKIDFDTYQEMIKKTKENIYTLDIRRNELKRTSNIPQNEQVDYNDLVRNIKDHWQYLNNDEKQAFLQNFVQEIIVATLGKGKDKSAIIKSLKFIG
jgi:site-specific DNA recombinase